MDVSVGVTADVAVGIVLSSVVGEGKEAIINRSKAKVIYGCMLNSWAERVIKDGEEARDRPHYDYTCSNCDVCGTR